MQIWKPPSQVSPKLKLDGKPPKHLANLRSGRTCLHHEARGASREYPVRFSQASLSPGCGPSSSAHRCCSGPLHVVIKALDDVPGARLFEIVGFHSVDLIVYRGLQSVSTCSHKFSEGSLLFAGPKFAFSAMFRASRAAASRSKACRATSRRSFSRWRMLAGYFPSFYAPLQTQGRVRYY